jgi:hypothetical protein
VHYIDVSGQLPTLAALSPDKNPFVSTQQDAGLVPESVWNEGEVERSLDAIGNLTPGQPLAQ